MRLQFRGNLALVVAVVLCGIHGAAVHMLADRPSRRFPESEYANALERELIEASFDGNIKKAKECLAKGARVNARYGGKSEYFKSAGGGWPTSGFNWTSLMAATENDRFELAGLLVDNGASVKMDDGWGATPLYALANKEEQRKEYDALTALFIGKGADANAKTDVYIDGPGNETVLHKAVGWGHANIVKMLLAAGANVNAQTSDGSTPLDYLCKGRRDHEIRKILEAAGAKVGTKRKSPR